MTETYRIAALEEAEAESAKARAAFNTATTRKARREADESLNFWTNKVAFLSHVRGDATMRTIKSLDELRELAAGRTLYIRYSHSHEADIKRGYSLDHSAMRREPGLSVQVIEGDEWDGSRGWLARVIADYGGRVKMDDGSYGWVATGTVSGRDSDDCPTLASVTCLAILDRDFVLRCLAYSRDTYERDRTHRGVSDSRPWPQIEDYGI